MSSSIVRPAPGDAVDVDVQVVPRASRTRVVGVHGERLKIQLAAPPVDGAANKALVELFAAILKIPRTAVAIAQGAASKRKTVRLEGTTVEGVRAALDLDGGGATTEAGARRRRSPRGGDLPRAVCLVAALTLPFAGGCESDSSLHLRVLLPEDDADLDRADNAALVLDPGGPELSYDIDGTDFTLEVELELDDVQRVAYLYLARGTDLLAWGRSAPFVLAGTGEDLAIFLGRPGALSTFPGAVSGAEGMVAARARGRGMLLVAEDGGTYLLSERELEVSAGDDFPAAAPPASAGALVDAADGAVIRARWDGALTAWRFDPGADAWSEAALVGDEDLGGRDGAAWIVDASAEHLLVLGGGDASDIAELTLVPDDDGALALRRLDVALDGPRRGATPVWVVRDGTDEGEGLLLFGGDQDDLPLAYFTAAAPAGPPLRWTAAACAQVERGEDASATATLRILCFGGRVDGTPTADAALLRVPPGGALEIEHLPDWLPEPLADPRLFTDEGAIYAQSEGRWLRVERGALTPELSATTATRATGGHSVNLGTGVTFLVGGVTAEGQPTDRWQVFTPSP
ncbi:MAG: DUF167 domain-containing protein [Nannocystaceae bacterium]